MRTLGRRRTERILAPVRIRVTGNDRSGVLFDENTVTVSFSQEGARISLPQAVSPDGVVLVRNLENGLEAEFRVVGAYQQAVGSRREWGVEAINPRSTIWGVEFAVHDDSALPKVLIQCEACKTAAQTTLSSVEYDVLLAIRRISRHCDHCNATTRWEPSDQIMRAQMLVRPSRSEGDVKSDRRRVRRLKLTMQLRVRNALGVVDIAQTHDVCKSGLCFVSRLRFSPSDEIYITLPHAQNQPPTETRGKVVWVAEGTLGRFYGVEYVR
jgi:hypothetical protein